jgi:DNA-binding response OmpR family regulator
VCASGFAVLDGFGVVYTKGTKVKHRILVVEDDPLSRELLESWLIAEGHEVILAETLEEGFVRIASIPLPDVVLLDIQLGNQSGMLLAQWARRQRHLEHLPIAAMTGFATFKELKSIGESGCNTCFTKPIEFRALREYLAYLAIYSVGESSR